MSNSKSKVFRQAIKFPISVQHALVPQNLTKERVRWMLNKAYNPQFVYDTGLLEQEIRRAEELRACLSHFYVEHCQKQTYADRFISTELSLQLEVLKDSATLLRRVLLNQLSADSGALDFPNSRHAIARVFCLPTPHELKLAEMLRTDCYDNVITEHLFDDDESSYDQTALVTLIERFLHDFGGNTDHPEINALRAKTFNWQDITDVCTTFLTYYCEMAKVPTPKLKFVHNYGLRKFGIQFEELSYKLNLTVPADMAFDGFQLLGALAHELAHIHSSLTTGLMTKNLFPEHFSANLIANGPWRLPDEGFAKLSETSLCGEIGLAEPHYTLAAFYASQGHNFAETAEYLYDRVRRTPGQDSLLDAHVWETLNCFFGQTDTSGHSGFITPKDSYYFLGPLRVLRFLCDKGHIWYDEPLKLMRFSNLDFSLIKLINKHELSERERFDPLGFWSLGHTPSGSLDPLQILKHILLEHSCSSSNQPIIDPEVSTHPMADGY